METKVSNSADYVAPTTFLENSSRKKGKSQIIACDTSYIMTEKEFPWIRSWENEMIDA